jgi:hypothetical protein
MSAWRSSAQRRTIWPPEAGTFALRLVKNGWRVPARIVLDDDDRWYAEIDGAPFAAHPDPVHAPMVDVIWHGGIRIDEQTYQWLLAVKAHAQAHEPDHPALHPRKAIDPRLLKPLHF